MASQLATSIVNAVSFETDPGERTKVPRAGGNGEQRLFCGSTRYGRITFVNEFAQRLLGCSESELAAAGAPPSWSCPKPTAAGPAVCTSSSPP
ncbi:MAG: hypothetical protein MZV70_15130 [Desulfobacterales bacterium]|nr:hypothetical protein [Desulfobacterales bacterium]